jgi:dCTP deaminase
MLLSDKRILEELNNGNIVIDPFDIRQLGTNSYDCRLGEWYFCQGETQGQDVHLFGEDLRAVWGEPRKAVKGEIPVYPGTTILAHTIEVVGGRNGFIANMYARSTVARSGLSVCKCAGLGDCGYIARYTMEISNFTCNTIWMPVGGRIAQMCFFETGPTLKLYAGSYGQEKVWTPYDMLPSSKHDWAADEYKKAASS